VRRGSLCPGERDEGGGGVAQKTETLRHNPERDGQHSPGARLRVEGDGSCGQGGEKPTQGGVSQDTACPH